MRPVDYQALRNEYSAYISAEQLYKICRISKGSASYLLRHGIIPCIDSGKKTRRYKIKLDDVIDYLQKREKDGTMIPVGAANPKRKKKPKPCFSLLLAVKDEHTIFAYFSFLSSNYPDVLTTENLVTLTGLTLGTIQRFLQQGTIKAISSQPSYLVPKEYFLDFVTSNKYLCLKSNSEAFRKIIGGFESWIAVK